MHNQSSSSSASEKGTGSLTVWLILTLGHLTTYILTNIFSKQEGLNTGHINSYKLISTEKANILLSSLFFFIKECCFLSGPFPLDSQSDK